MCSGRHLRSAHNGLYTMHPPSIGVEGWQRGVAVLVLHN
jgi:hypothetical protein